MDILASFIIKSFITSGVLYLYYLAALKNKKFHSYNRFYLLFSTIISFAIPFVNFSWVHIQASQNMPLSQFVSTINAPVSGPPVKFFAPVFVLISVSAFISILLLILLALKIRWIYSIKRRNTNIKMHGFTFIETDIKHAPFSFLSNLFWKQGLSATDINGEKIFKHELAHIMQKHTYDKLFAQIVFCIFWMNPFYWLMQKELNTIHEFMADAASVENGDTESFAEMLLHAHNEGSYLSPVHPFFNSSIKRRLTMISSSNKTQYSWLRRILALPVVLSVLALLSVSVTARTNKKAGSPITVKEVQQPSGDTIPKAGKKQSLRPKTVTGYKLEKEQNLEPITVTGYKLDKKQSLEPITVIGYKLDKKQSLEPITVTGYKLEKEQNLEPITVTGYKLDKKQSLEPIIVTGHKSDKKENLEPIIVTGRKSE